MARGLERVSNADKALLMHADLDTGWKDRPPWHATVTDSGVILYPPALSCVSKSPYKLPFIPFLEFPQLKLWTDHKLIMLFATNMQNRIQPYPYIFLVLQEFCLRVYNALVSYLHNYNSCFQCFSLLRFFSDKLWSTSHDTQRSPIGK